MALQGVGMAYEWPRVLTHTDFQDTTEEYFLPGRVFCVESLIVEPGSECIKLETQALVTATGHERLERFPFETV